MFTKLMHSIFGEPSQRNLKRVKGTIDQINKLDEEYGSLSDDQLRDKTAEFRERIEKGATLDELLPEAFAAVKQACKRLCGQTWEAGGTMFTWEMVPFDVQLCGGIYLHQGNIAEMATGEGKTLVAVAPLYLNALAGKGAHLVTVNDYLARRDGEWMGKIFETLGMTVGIILSNMEPAARRVAYHADVTYGTNNEFGFDYLRDNMAWHSDNLVQRGHYYGIVDEVDSVLIDEARTPLIISGQVDRPTNQYTEIKPMVAQLVKRQQELTNQIVAEGARLLKDAENEPNEKKAQELRYQAGIKLLQARKGSPKNKKLMEISNDGGIQRLIEKVENEFIRDKKVPQLEADLFFVIDERGHMIDLTEQGREAISPDDPDVYMIPDIVDEIAAIENQDIPKEEKEKKVAEVQRRFDERTELLHNMSQMLRAYVLYEKDREYIIEDNKVVIIDEYTGRKMSGRRWSDGLHQAVEAKEGVKIEKETQTLATITLQNYFRMYDKLAGMTGTAETEASEFAHTYGMNVAVIPTNRPIRRREFNDLIYKTQREKYTAIIKEIERLHKLRLPVLVGTTSVDMSELLSKMLESHRISHAVLNAKFHEREAQIVMDAGQLGAVTIATNMAGRGTDIKLGPGVLDKPEGWDDNPENPPRGLQVIGTERHEARRIDRQLMGRAGRQGDPGSAKFFVSLEDDLMRLFASEKMANLMGKGFEEGEPISHPLANRAINTAQKRIEGMNFDQRKRTLEFDDVMNLQREAIYTFRRAALLAQDANADHVLDIVEKALLNCWEEYCGGREAGDWDLDGFKEMVRRFVVVIDLEGLPDPTTSGEEEFLREIMKRCVESYEKKTEAYGPELMAMFQRYVILQVIDQNWRDHLPAIDQLRTDVHLEQYGQKQPLVIFRSRASEMYQEMFDNVHKEIFERIFRIQLRQEEPQNAGVSNVSTEKEQGRRGVRATLQQEAERQQAAQHAASESGGEGEAPRRTAPMRRSEPKVKANDPCPCGSGRKYKKCCGAAGQAA